jgi:hypothetical protein
VRAQVEFATHPKATLVPFSALARRDGREGVFVVEHTAAAASNAQPQKGVSPGPALHARFVLVTIGIVNGEAVEIVEPQISGSVVTLGNHLLEDGSRVTLPESRTAEGGQKVSLPGPGDGPGSGSRTPNSALGSPSTPAGGAR